MVKILHPSRLPSAFLLSSTRCRPRGLQALPPWPPKIFVGRGFFFFCTMDLIQRFYNEEELEYYIYYCWWFAQKNNGTVEHLVGYGSPLGGRSTTGNGLNIPLVDFQNGVKT